TNCTFEGCLYAFNVYDKGFTLSNCSFIENINPIRAENLSSNSSIHTASIHTSSTQFDDGAITLIGSTSVSSTVLVNEVDMDNIWRNGLYAKHCRVNMKCSSINSWSTPIVLDTDAVLDMSKA